MKVINGSMHEVQELSGALVSEPKAYLTKVLSPTSAKQGISDRRGTTNDIYIYLQNVDKGAFVSPGSPHMVAYIVRLVTRAGAKHVIEFAWNRTTFYYKIASLVCFGCLCVCLAADAEENTIRDLRSSLHS